MKTSTLYALALGISCAIALGGCKKLSSSASSGNKKNGGDPGPVSNNSINPKTTAASCDYDMSDTALTNHGWSKVFEDNFDNGLGNWNALHGGLTEEVQCYEPGNAQVTNGVLSITARKESVTGPKTIGNDTSASFDFTSAWIVSKQAFAPSASASKMRIVARLKMASGYGLTSLFYSYGNAVWPTAGEIDFAETQGDNTKSYATDYAYGTSPDVNLVSGGVLYNPVTEDLSACYHVYVMEWTKNSLNSYLDGQLVESKTAGNYVPSLFGHPQYLSLSVPVGGLYYNNLNTANISGGTLYVDYVKVYTSN